MLNHGHKYSQCIVCMCETGVVFGKKLAQIAKTFFTREDSCKMPVKLKYTVNDYSPLQALYRQMLFFHRHSSNEIYSLKLNHLLNFTLHFKPNACNIGTCFRFYMQMLFMVKLQTIDFIPECIWKKSICLQSAYRGL